MAPNSSVVIVAVGTINRNALPPSPRRPCCQLRLVQKSGLLLYLFVKKKVDKVIKDTQQQQQQQMIALVSVNTVCVRAIKWPH